MPVSRVRLECNPEIPVAPGEEHWLLDTSLDEVYWPCSHSRAMPSFPSQLEWKIGLGWANTRGILNSPSGLPNDVTAEFQSNPVLPGATSELTIKTTRKTPLKRYTFTISGSTDSITHKAKALLQVKSPKSVISIQRSYSSDKTVLLVSRYKPSKDSVIANTYIMNTTGTWVKATASTEAGSVPLNKGEDYVILLGPYATKSLGNLTFHDGEFLSYTGERANFEALTVLAIDLFLRGTLGQEVPPGAFY